MIINKYNSAKGNITTRAGVSTGAISGGTSSSGGGSLDRVLWGQNDDGEDIDGSMWVNGSLYIGAIDYGSEDDEATVDNSNVFVDDAEIGSVIASGLVQGKDMYCKEHPYITYPIVGGKKTDLRELFNGFDERIKTNATNIAANTANISTNATNIAANTAEITKLKSRVTVNETNIKTNTTNIAANATNIKNLDKRVTVNETNIKTNTTNITGLDTRVTDLETSVTDLSTSVDTNTTDISTLKTDVSTNTTDIKNLDTRVTANETNISTNTTNITSIDTRVTKLENKVADKSDYADLKTKVDNNTNNIATNATDITTIKNEIKNLQDAMPVGSIIMFNGQAADIPSGWAICNGENGTPNLINKFVKGSNIAGSTGGASQVTLSVAQLPPHRHKVSKCWYGQSDNANDRQTIRWDERYDTNAQVWTGETGLGLPIDIIPPYYTLIYIMKIGTTDTDTTQTT